MQKKHTSTTVHEEILLELHHHLARLASLIEEYLFSLKKLSGPTLKIHQRQNSEGPSPKLALSEGGSRGNIES